MKARLFLFFLLIGSCTFIQAQSPQQFNFQGAARDAGGAPYTNAEIAIRISLVRGSAVGVIDYAERHEVTTSPRGVFDLIIGSGAILSGTMNDVDWSNNAYYLKIDMDPNGGDVYINLGSSQLMSVPYALFANEAANAGDSSQSLFFDPQTNELSISDGNAIILPEAGVGPQGPQGVAGSQGLTGSQGEQGPAGPQGSQGEQGPVGQAGTGVQIVGTVATVGNLPAMGNQGDLYIVEADGDGYVWDGSMWTNVGQIQGPQGLQGSQGAAGIQGTMGEQGIQGSVGEQGPVGPQGIQGTIGAQGLPGQDGVDGTGVQIVGTVATVGNLPAMGSPGDLYIVEADGDGYVWDGAMWTNVGQIQGPAGADGTVGSQGEQGPAGADGAAGSQGEQGPAGADGVAGPQGEQGPAGNHTAGDGIIINGNEISAEDTDPLNEIQVLSIASSTISLSNGGGSVTLPPGGGPTYSAGFGIQISGANVISNTGDNDEDTTNEIQTLSINAASTTISLSNGGGSVLLPDSTPDGDGDSSNEIQILSINAASTTISLSNGGGSVLLPDSTPDGDGDSSNEIQTLSLNAASTTLTLSDGGGTVSLPDTDPLNEIQILSIASSTLSLSNGGGSVQLPPGGGADGDGDSSNEIQMLSIASSTISLSNGGGSVTLPPGGGPAYSAGFGIQISGANVISNTGDNDEDTTNEIQTLSINAASTTISLSNGGGSVLLPDSTPDGDGDSSNEIQILSINAASTTISLSNGGGSVLLPDSTPDGDGDSSNEIQTLSLNAASTTLTLSDGGGSVDLRTYSAGFGIQISGANVISNTGDNDEDDTNEIQVLSYNAASSTLSLTNGGESVNLGIPDSIWMASGTLIYYDQGRVGVATNAPESDLHVDGTFRIGSSEEMRDGGTSVLEIDGGLRSYFDGVDNLGSAGLRWNTLFATNGVINTSDRRDKQNILDLDYGLTELLQLRPVSYEWTAHPEQGRKLGLIAQELQPILSEVVEDKEMQRTEDGKIKYSDAERLGVYYSDLIPVLIKATQEQQEIIETQKQEIEVQRRELDEMKLRLKAIEALLLKNKN